VAAQHARVVKAHAKNANVIKAWDNILEKAQIYEAAINAHMKLCPVWAAYTRKEAHAYHVQLIKKYHAASHAYRKAKAPATLTAYYEALSALQAYRGKWHQGAAVCRCSLNLLRNYARPVVKRLNRRVARLQKKWRHCKNPKVRKIFKKRINRAKVRVATVKKVGNRRLNRRWIKKVIRRSNKVRRNLKKTKSTKKRVVLKKKYNKLRLQYKTYKKLNKYRKVIQKRNLLRKTVRRTTVRRRVLRNVIRRSK